MKILEAVNISKSFGGLRALNNISFYVDEGEILGIIGPNGAGKTTLYNVMSGVLKPASGRIIFRNEDLTGLPMHQVTKRGLKRTFQATTVWKGETVLDNVFLASYLHRKAGLVGWFINTRYAQKEELDIQLKVESILEYMRLKDFKGELAKNLPHGKLRALGICIALASNTDILLLDEPVTGMNPVEKAEIVELVKGLRKRGLTIIIIEHDMETVMNLVDRIVVLDHGEKIAEGSPNDIKKNRIVIEAYLGTSEEEK